MTRLSTRLLLLFLVSLVGGGALAEPLVLETTGHYQLRIGEALDQDARVYKVLRGVPHFLLVSDLLDSAWLVAAVDKAARPVDKSAISSAEGVDDGVSLEAPSEGDRAPIKIEGGTVSFSTPDGRVLMEPREPLIGDLTLDQMLDYMPEYRRAASAFEPSKGQLRLLEAVKREVDVDVYFGTWCPHCEKLVPRMIKLASLVDNPKVRFHFRGVPGKIAEDPMARQYKIDGVPMALVRTGDQVLARLMGRDLIQPETSLNAALLGADS